MITKQNEKALSKVCTRFDKPLHALAFLLKIQKDGQIVRADGSYTSVDDFCNGLTSDEVPGPISYKILKKVLSAPYKRNSPTTEDPTRTPSLDHYDEEGKSWAVERAIYPYSSV